MKMNPEADSFKVILFGSLSKTGVGHGTDRIIIETFAPKKCEVEFDYTQTGLLHPNTMDIYAYRNNELIVPNVKAWSPETPELYTLELRANGEKIIESIGFRTVTIEGKVFKVNGRLLNLRVLTATTLTVKLQQP